MTSPLLPASPEPSRPDDTEPLPPLAPQLAGEAAGGDIDVRAGAAGATPVTAVLHYKPGRSRVAGHPDHYAATVEGWVTYPYKAGG